MNSLSVARSSGDERTAWPPLCTKSCGDTKHCERRREAATGTRESASPMTCNEGSARGAGCAARRAGGQYWRQAANGRDARAAPGRGHQLVTVPRAALRTRNHASLCTRSTRSQTLRGRTRSPAISARAPDPELCDLRVVNYIGLKLQHELKLGEPARGARPRRAHKWSTLRTARPGLGGKWERGERRRRRALGRAQAGKSLHHR